MTALNVLRLAAARAGLDVRRLGDSDAGSAQTLGLIRRSGVTLVLDVGANAGQFASELMAMRPGTRVVSFEPLSRAHADLVRAARRPGWEVADRMALGSREEVSRINVAGNSVSSSILPMLDRHASAEPTSRVDGSEEVTVRRLDAVIHRYARPDDRLYLKIDTQGYECQVLEGAAGCLDRVVALQVEMSLAPLYAGQPLFPELLAKVVAAGFRPYGFSNGFRDPRTGEILQTDGFFIRP